MIVKLLLALAVAYLGWRLWRGPIRERPVARVREDAPELAAARDVLGVPDDAEPSEIRAAHRRLVASAHPDRGGSEDETRRLNAARDVLLRSA